MPLPENLRRLSHDIQMKNASLTPSAIPDGDQEDRGIAQEESPAGAAISRRDWPVEASAGHPEELQSSGGKQAELESAPLNVKEIDDDAGDADRDADRKNSTKHSTGIEAEG